jgi:hypothetical protein
MVSQLPLSTLNRQSSERLLDSETCRIVNSRSSAIAAVRLTGHFSPQFISLLPLGYKSG